ncbi:PQQ-dependent sugar dehydrogenase [Oerskovia flava]|uniref:PQQ-dependent sugar dehydrogenase n=1 Tax=Oerskovia flava TaxID=2986422 RepID=UPI00223F232B|nr:PQQ-dependent sugar dehydrogenase [Oerskovia sp. JB1-3-2]
MTSTTAPPSSPSPEEDEPSPEDPPESSLRAVPEVDVEVSTVAEGLAAPWGLAPLADGRLLVSLRDERTLILVDPQDGSTTQVTGPGADDLRERTDATGEGGLMGLALDPDDEEMLYVYRTGVAANEVLRGRQADGTLADLEPVVTDIPKAGNHNGGRLAFGPDGYLYVATGDAAQPGTSQDPDALGGKILRVTTDGEPAPGNPDEGSPVWSLGHRNVQGLGWDATERMFASEFGQNRLDELNVVEPGANYGWPEREGTEGGGGDGLVDPIVTWETSRASPSGLAVTDEGVYVAGLRGQVLWRVPFAEGPGGVPDDGWSADAFGEPQALLTDVGRVRTVVARPDGGLWVLTNNTDGRGSPRAGDDRLLSVSVDS